MWTQLTCRPSRPSEWTPLLLCCCNTFLRQWEPLVLHSIKVQQQVAWAVS
jgi:hypothetical protein